MFTPVMPSDSPIPDPGDGCSPPPCASSHSVEPMMADTVSSILRHKGHDVWSVSPDDSVLQAMSLMADKDIVALIRDRR